MPKNETNIGEDRINAATADAVNERIRRDAEMRVRGYATQGPAAITQRIEELSQEWDIERALMTGAGINVLLGLTLGAAVNRRWFLFPAVVVGFLLQHTLQGWCPPLVPLRRLRIRTQDEINAEKYALKVLRGDFAGAADGQSGPALEAALQTLRD